MRSESCQLSSLSGATQKAYPYSLTRSSDSTSREGESTEWEKREAAVPHLCCVCASRGYLSGRARIVKERIQSMGTFYPLISNRVPFGVKHHHHPIDIEICPSRAGPRANQIIDQHGFDIGGSSRLCVEEETVVKSVDLIPERPVTDVCVRWTIQRRLDATVEKAAVARRCRTKR